MSLLKSLRSLSQMCVNDTYRLKYNFPVSITSNELRFTSPLDIQVRCFAARRGKRIAANRAKQLKAKQRREEEKQKGPKVWIPPHLRIDKSLVSYRDVQRGQRSLNVGPRRFSDAHLKDLSAIVDDVYVIGNYKEKAYSLDEIISMHRETHHPTIYNEPDALIEARVELDLRTKKKTKFLDAFSGIIRYPNEFHYQGNRKVVALCKKEEDQIAAKDAGAMIVGSTDIIKMIKVGDLTVNDFDDLVCHGDILMELAAIRGILNKAFPNKARGNVGFDMRKLVDHFVTSAEYKCVKDEFESNYGWVELAFGRLNMPDDILMENMEYLFAQLEKHSPQGAPCKLITRILISSKPSNEKLKLKHWEHIEGYSDPDAHEEVETDDKSNDKRVELSKST